MSFESFENLARLHVIGALDGEELKAFQLGRKMYGQRAEEHIRECRRMRAAFALSLRPKPPHQDGRQRLMRLIEQSLRRTSAEGGEVKDEG